MSGIDNERDPETLREINRLLALENQRLHKRLGELTAELAALQGKQAPEQMTLELSLLQEQMAAMQSRLFGDSSEKRRAEKPAKAKAAQRGHGRTAQPGLPVVVTPVELAEEDRMCPLCNEPMQPLGMSEDSELIDVLRKQFFLRKIQRKKYGCGCGVGIKTAPPPVKHVARGRYSLDFTAHTATDKWVNHMPLERQKRDMQRLGLDVTSQSLWDQVQALAGELEPICQSLRQYILGSDVVGIDETWWRLMEKKSSQRWWVWNLTTPDAVWYGIDPSRSAKTARAFLGDFSGTLVCDGYAAYQTLARECRDVRLALCWSHARRKFVEAEPNYPGCATAIDLIGQLFQMDRDSADPSTLSGDEKLAAAAERHRLRTERAPPLLDELKAWALAQRGLPKSGLRKATDYLLGHWEPLRTFLDDPFVPLHNNDTERALRGVVVGRKNHYGSRSLRGTEVAAVYYSLLETAVRNDLDPHAYLISAAYGMHYGDDPGRLLPLAHLWP